MLYTKSCAHLVHGITLVKQTDHSAPGRKNISGILKKCAKGSNVAKHAGTFDHVIAFDNSIIIDKRNNCIRKTLESWHTAKTVEVDNNPCPLPRQYNILLNKH